MTQSQLILNHLKIYGSITPQEALRLYHCFRLAARIGELKVRYPIQSTLVRAGDATFARYTLDQLELL